MSRTPSTSPYKQSSCELLEMAMRQIEHHFGSVCGDGTETFKKVFVQLTIFRDIHFSKSFKDGEIEEKIERLLEFVTVSPVIGQLLGVLCSNFSTDVLDKPKHLCYVNSGAINYLNTAKFLADHFSNQKKNLRVISWFDILKERREGTVEQKYLNQIIIQQLEQMGFFATAYKMLVSTVAYVASKLDLSCVKTFTVLFPFSATERYLFELINQQCRTILLPHGLPQRSFCRQNFDYVFALTTSTAWRQLFPKSHVVHVGWPEIIPMLTRQKGFGRSVGNTVIQHRKRHITFLSQLTGATIHRMDDFVRVAEFFISEAMKLDQKQYLIEIRLRNQDEIDLIDDFLVKQVEISKNVSFVIMADSLLSNCKTDLLVGTSSTGMLYSSYLRVPSIQLTTKQILAHWPFELSGKNELYIYQDDKRDFCSLISKIVSSSINKMLYNSPSFEASTRILDVIYS